MISLARSDYDVSREGTDKPTLPCHPPGDRPGQSNKLVAELNAVLERGDGKVNELHGDGSGHQLSLLH
jgi:hypothetical protein